jgi:hypothetical protein
MEKVKKETNNHQIEIKKAFLNIYNSPQSFSIIDNDFDELLLYANIVHKNNRYNQQNGEKQYNLRKNRYKDILPCKIRIFELISQNYFGFLICERKKYFQC